MVNKSNIILTSTRPREISKINFLLISMSGCAQLLDILADYMAGRGQHENHRRVLLCTNEPTNLHTLFSRNYSHLRNLYLRYLQQIPSLQTN